MHQSINQSINLYLAGNLATLHGRKFCHAQLESIHLIINFQRKKAQKSRDQQRIKQPVSRVPCFGFSDRTNIAIAIMKMLMRDGAILFCFWEIFWNLVCPVGAPAFGFYVTVEI